MLHFESEGRIPFGRGSQFFSLLSTDWMRHTRIMKGNLLYSGSTDGNVNFILKKKITYTAVSKLVFDQMSGNCSLAKLIPKIHHHSVDLELFGIL